MPVFTKRPVDVEARRFDGSAIGGQSLYEWIVENGGGAMIGADFGASTATLVVITLEGKMNVSPGDWLIKGVKGEFYPCREDIFEETYSRAMLSEPEYATVQELNIVAAKALRWWENAAAAAGGAVIGSVLAWALLLLP